MNDQRPGSPPAASVQSQAVSPPTGASRAPGGDPDPPAPPAPHPTSVAVWGVPSPVVTGRRFTVTVGVRCASGCRLTGLPVVVRDAAGAAAGEGRLGEAPSPGTRALYDAEVALVAPGEKGVHAWTGDFSGGAVPDTNDAGLTPPDRETAGRSETPEAAASPAAEKALDGAAAASPAEAAASPAEAAASPAEAAAKVLDAAAASPDAVPASEHAPSSSAFSFRTTDPPDHRVTVTLCERAGQAPLAGAEVRIGFCGATTDAAGRAALDVPAGEHEVSTRKAGYEPHARRITVTGDLALRIDTARVADADLDDDQVWM